MSESAQLGAPCPSCGVVVATGYVKCPRCHNSLKGAQSARAKRISMHGGATSLGDAGENRLGWILGGLVVLAIAVIVIIFIRAQRQSAEPVTQAPSANNLAVPTAGQPGLVNGGAQAPDLDQAPPTLDLEAARSPADAVRELQSAMQLRRVWASTGIDTKDPSIVTIQSGQCEDEAMREALDAVRPVLKKAAFVAVRCIAQHGTDVFQERL